MTHNNEEFWTEVYQLINDPNRSVTEHKKRLERFLDRFGKMVGGKAHTRHAR